MTFAITGANGFLGVHIIHHLLNQGHYVIGIVRPNASLSEFELARSFYSLDNMAYVNLKWVDCDLHDVEGLEEIFCNADYVMHLAGYISYLKRDLNKLLKVNCDYTANVVNAAKNAQIKKLLYCSSIAAISKNSKSEFITENTYWDDEQPHSNYGYSKYLGECEVWRAKEEGLSAVIINPGIILGFGDWNKGSNKLFKNAASGFPFYSNGITGWVGVQDVALIAEKLCISELTGERYIVVSENLSYKNVALLMASNFGVKEPSIEIKGWLYKLCMLFVSIKELLGFRGMLSRETVRASVAVNYFSNDKVRNALKIDLNSMNSVIKASIAKGYKKSPSN